ncbi:MAG: hypothetical protein AAF943_12025 [Pseudomonadota bacterium]
MGKGPLFLERAGYRKRRMMDAIRILPFLGLIVFMLPLLWPVGGDLEGPVTTSVALRYLFCGWVALCAGAWILWRMSAARAEKGTSTEP